MNGRQEHDLIDGRYRLITELGSGAFGSVHRATQVVLGKNLREVALKLFRAEVINEHNVRKEMNDALAIIRLISECSDWEIRQHFLTIYDLGLTQETPPRAYIAMELVSDGSLTGRLKTPFTLDGIVPYLTQTVRALAFMHRHQFVHADLKPDNILVFRHRDHDQIKIGDFGLAGQHTGLFGDGPRGGDMAYIAPELLDGMSATPAADVFSLGVMFFEMLTGKNPYAEVGHTLTAEQRRDDERMRKLRRDYRRKPMRLSRADYPELKASPRAELLGSILDIINRMLEPELHNRYRSAVEIQRDLDVAANNAVPGAQSSPRSSETTSVRSAAEPDPSTLQINAMREKWESFVGLRNWVAAEETARELIAEQPGVADGYQLLSQIHLKMAAGYEGDASPRASKRRQTCLRQAGKPLREGIQQCRDRDELRQLQLDLAKIHVRLGDDATADRLRREASGTND